jgi:hypothetical protein
MSETVTSVTRKFSGAKYGARHHFFEDYNEWNFMALKFESYYYQIITIISHLKVLKLNIPNRILSLQTTFKSVLTSKA